MICQDRERKSMTMCRKTKAKIVSKLALLACVRKQHSLKKQCSKQDSNQPILMGLSLSTHQRKRSARPRELMEGDFNGPIRNRLVVLLLRRGGRKKAGMRVKNKRKGVR